LKAIPGKIGARTLSYIPAPLYDKEVDIAKAVEAASKADAVVICLGEWANAETPGNIPDLTLPDAQLSLTLRIMERKKPVILVLTRTPAYQLTALAASAKAIVMAYTQQRRRTSHCGYSFGDVNPVQTAHHLPALDENRLFTYDQRCFPGRIGEKGRHGRTAIRVWIRLELDDFLVSDLQWLRQRRRGARPIRVDVAG